MVRGHTRSIGVGAERIAFGYLQARGLKPICRNFRRRCGEIDLIMLDAATLVFIEVRYRSASSFVSPEWTVDYRKQRKLIATAALFLSENRAYEDSACRFDVVGIDRRDAARVRINWLQDAFCADF